MTRRIPFGVALALLLVTAAVTVTLTVAYYTKQTDALIGDLPQRAGQYELLEEVEALVHAEYYGTADAAAQRKSLVEGYLSGLGDPLTRYYTPEEYAALQKEQNGRAEGTGIVSVFDRTANALTVRSIAPYSAANGADVRVGDVILSVNGETVSYENAETLIGRLAEGSNGVIRISARHVGETQPYELELKTGYTVPACDTDEKEDFGYIRVIRFSDDTPELFKKAVDRFLSEQVKGLIIDVRNNDAGSIPAAVSAIDRIVPLATEGTGAIATEENAAGEAIHLYAADSQSVNLPIVVLMNSRTGGAAELFACDLREFGKACLIGEPTAGHGTGQQIFTLKNGGAVSLTVSKLISYLGNSFDEAGVSPDEVVPMSAAQKDLLFTKGADEDAQLQAAIAFLKG